MHTAIVGSVRINIRQCTRKRHGTRRYHGIIRNSRNVGEIKRMRKQWIPGPFSFEWAWVRGSLASQLDPLPQKREGSGELRTHALSHRNAISWMT